MTPAAAQGPQPSSSGSKLHRVQDRTTHAQLRRTRRIRRGALTVSCIADPGSDRARVAYAIGRNVGGAVHRNRARRRLRAVMAELGPRLSGRAWLVGAGPEVLRTDFEALRADADAAVSHLAAR
ncbi:MAG TPA: ribonuclease P protein component [Acidimicrobiales bacterium]|nr:ribonuclease P protein component [Acidimicrobiales bacterium]